MWSDPGFFRSFLVNSTVKTVVFWVVIGLSALLLWTVIQQGRGGQKDAEVQFLPVHD